ncbi:hypothetical protein [Winogradskyella algicola]|uniref:hypothetical protein n=1 Tax=Winogradskyella algicola TaxID=2575815 RepID=UPI001109488F|nr:hypothetical protein [Winogradskyella algicola]
MKKILLLFCAFALVTACENEPLDPAFSGGGNNNGGGNGSSDDITLSKYELDVTLNTSLFGFPFETIVKTDYFLEENSLGYGEIETTATVLGETQTVTETQTVETNSEGQVISFLSINSLGQTTNTTSITYDGNNISNITYNYFEDNEEDYEYNFSYNGNTITRTEVGTTISTVFTLDENNRFFKKESFDDGNLILSETVTFNEDGNCATSITTGDNNLNITYSYDNFENPIPNQIYNLGNMLSILNDDYEDTLGDALSHDFASNNCIATSINGELYNFDVTYDNSDRISTRAYEISLEEDGVSLTTGFNEIFTYAN